MTIVLLVSDLKDIQIKNKPANTRLIRFIRGQNLSPSAP
jgi:hypothetical protein